MDLLLFFMPKTEIYFCRTLHGKCSEKHWTFILIYDRIEVKKFYGGASYYER